MNIEIYTIPYELHNEMAKIDSLFKSGLETLHIRKPGYSVMQLSKILDGIDEAYHPKIVLHSHFGLALRYDVQGIHINNGNVLQKLQAKFIKTLKPRTRVSATASKVQNAARTSSVVDHVMLGPLYFKYSETNVRSRFDSLELRNLIKNSDKMVYALGGIDLANIEYLKGIGFSGVVLQTSIWKSPDILNSLHAFQLLLGKDEAARTVQLAI